MNKQRKILVTGAGGFIGHNLVKRLKKEGNWIRGVDLKYPEFEPSPADEFEILDLQFRENCLRATTDITKVYTLAADMGGIGYITANHANIALKNILINANMLEASRINGVRNYLFTSSACVYPQYKQNSADVTPLKEEDAYPADPEKSYGWEKLYTEQLCRYYREDFQFVAHVVRLHNVYGPLGTYEGGREKAPAAISRKIALAKDGDEIEIWGDGEQTRSFMYIDDCIEGLMRIMKCDYHGPLNLGTDHLVTINKLVDIIAGISGKKIIKHHVLDKPQGVRGRNSDNTRLRQVIGWEPGIQLEEGLEKTYRWIESDLKKTGRL